MHMGIQFLKAEYLEGAFIEIRTSSQAVKIRCCRLKLEDEIIVKLKLDNE